MTFTSRPFSVEVALDLVDELPRLAVIEHLNCALHVVGPIDELGDEHGGLEVVLRSRLERREERDELLHAPKRGEREVSVADLLVHSTSPVPVDVGHHVARGTEMCACRHEVGLGDAHVPHRLVKHLSGLLDADADDPCDVLLAHPLQLAHFVSLPVRATCSASLSVSSMHSSSVRMGTMPTMSPAWAMSNPTHRESSESS